MSPVASTKASNLLRRRPGESDDIGWVLPGGSEEVSDLSINMLHHERLTRVKCIDVIASMSNGVCVYMYYWSKQHPKNLMLTIVVFRRAANNDIPVIRSPAADNDIPVI